MRTLLPLLFVPITSGTLLVSLFLFAFYHQESQVLGLHVASVSASRKIQSEHQSKVISLTPSLKPTPTASPTPTSTPTLTPTPTKTPLPSPTPIQSGPKLATDAILSSQEQTMLAKINAYRASFGLSAVKPDKNTCDFAQTRAHELTTDFSHTGFTNRINNHTLPYSSYTEVTENIAQTQDPTQVIQLWVNSPGHAENMRADTPFVCVKGDNGYYAYEGWKQ